MGEIPQTLVFLNPNDYGYLGNNSAEGLINGGYVSSEALIPSRRTRGWQMLADRQALSFPPHRSKGRRHKCCL